MRSQFDMITKRKGMAFPFVPQLSSFSYHLWFYHLIKSIRFMMRQGLVWWLLMLLELRALERN